MSLSRRRFLQSTSLGLGTTLLAGETVLPTPHSAAEAEVQRLLDAPVLELSAVKAPVIVASLELLKNGGNYLVRARSREGVEAVTVPHPGMMALAYPVLLGKVFPHYLGKDARELETLHQRVYRSDYKLQGQLYWSARMAVEQVLLELLARSAQVPLATFFGGQRRQEIPVYFASNKRGNAPEEEVAHLQSMVANTGVRALKFRVGGRMSRNADSRPGRSEALIRLARQAFGPDMVLSVDANSSYDAQTAIRLGRLLEEQGYAFFEEPCEFDDLWQTQQVAEALSLPIAGGEQEYSHNRWRWMIAHRAVDIVQPDLHYGGGFIRATQVARAAAHAGLTVVPHMSDSGLGYLDVVHFASFTPNIGPYQEFKGNTDLPVSCATSSLTCQQGRVTVPTGIGFGIEIDPAYVRGAERVH